MTPYLMKVQDTVHAEDQFCCLLLAERVHSGYDGEAHTAGLRNKFSDSNKARSTSYGLYLIELIFSQVIKICLFCQVSLIYISQYYILQVCPKVNYSIKISINFITSSQ